MPRIVALAFAALLGFGSLGAPAAVRAGECPGMDDYRYDHGECTDASYDTSQIMRDMYHASDRLEEEREGRGRDAGGGSMGGGSGDAARGDRGMAARHSYARSVGRLMRYADDPAVTERTIAVIAAKMAPAPAGRNVRLVRARLAAYRLLARSYDLPDDTLAAPAYVLVLQAYRGFDGETLPDGFGGMTYATVAELLVPFASKLTDARREAMAEWMAISAAALAVDGPTAPRREVRSSSLTFLTRLGIDPAHVRLDQIICLEPIYGRNLDCAQQQWIASGGRMGRNPVTRHMVGR